MKQCKPDVICAADYGTPQKRMRFVIVGVKRSIANEALLPTPRFKPEEYLTVRHAIEDLENVVPVDDITQDYGMPVSLPEEKGPLSKLRDSTTIWNHIITQTTPTALSRFKAIKQGENFHALSDDLKSKLISTANKFSSLYQPANFYTSILLMYILPTIYILMTFSNSKGKFSADASEVFIPDNAMLLPRKCNETMVNFYVHFPRFYAIFATISPFINKRFQVCQ